MRLIPPQAVTAGAFSRASTATYVDDDGLIASAAIDEARYQSGALLLEPAATNLLLYSEDLRNTVEAGTARPWSQYIDGNCEVALTSDINPAGGASSSKLQCSNTGAVSRQVGQYSIAVADNTIVCFSVFVKAAEVPRLCFIGSIKVALVYPMVYFDTATGLASSPSAAPYTPVSFGSIYAGNGWWRCWMAFDVLSGVNPGFGVTISLRAPSGASYSGAVGDGVLLWGAQAELGVTEPTSYIPTTSAAVTRAADVFTRGMLSNVPETDHATWAGGTTYAAGNRVILTSTHRIYESLQAGNVGHAPDTSPDWWLDVGPTNRWAMFDVERDTKTALASSPLRVVLAPSYANAICLLGMEGVSVAVTVTDGGSPTVAYNATVDLVNPYIVDWYDYVFEPFAEAQEVVLADLPAFENAIITVTISSSSSTACALAAAGVAFELGGANYGVRIGIVDYSRKETDDFGTTTFVRRAFSQRISLDLMISNDQINRLYRAIAGIRATPCIWQVVDSQTLQMLTFFGFYRDFSVTISYPAHSIFALELEGLA